MTARKQNGPIEKIGLLTIGSGVSSEEHLTERSMNYWLEKINPEDTARLWKHLRANAKAALPSTTWVSWVNGTIERVALRLDVTACTTQGGFVMSFTVSDMSKSDGGANEARLPHPK